MDDRKPGQPLRSLASLVLLSGKILDLPSPGGVNSSYTTTIPCPLVSCSQRTIENMGGTGINSTMGHFSIDHFSVSWPIKAANLTVERIESIKRVRVPGQKDSDAQSVWEATVNKTVLECYPTLARLVLNISYVEGIRHIAYVKEDVQIFNPNLGAGFIYQTEDTQTRINSLKLDLWTAEMRKIAQVWNIWAVLDAALQAFEFKCEGNLGTTENENTGDWEITFDTGCKNKGQPQIVAFRIIRVLTIVAALPFIDMFLSDKRRQADEAGRGEDLVLLRDLNITETTINEYLIKVAISALSLNAGTAPVPVNISTYQATYEFSNPLNLILPYSLSLLFCTVFVGIGIWSWTHNGASAADGGFLQVMTATTGRTRMEDLVTAQHIDNDNLPEELLDLEIRYGELLDAEGVGTGVAGFGTVEETKLLRKGWRSG
jgi:hypothetical protein